MKLNKLKITSFLAMAFAMGFTGCLKDDDFDNGSIQSVHGDIPNVIELKVSATDLTKFAVIAFNNSTDESVIDLVPVTLATGKPAQEDIHVSVLLDSNLVNAYDLANGEDHVIPDEASYTVVNPTVIIPKGSNVGYLQVKLKPSDFLGANWALGFKIDKIQESGYEISGNISDAVVALAVKNEYDGIYHAFGHFDHPSFGGDFDRSDWVLQTASGTANTFPLWTTVNFSIIVKVDVNPGTNSLTITATSGGAPFALLPVDPAKNYYDPATKTYHFAFGYPGTPTNRFLDCVATYIGPR